MHSNEEAIPPIVSHLLRPYISLLFLEHARRPEELSFEDAEEHAFSMLIDFIAQARRDREDRIYFVVNSGFEDNFNVSGIDQIDGFIHKLETHPSWSSSKSTYIDTNHTLSIIMRRGGLFAVHCESSLRDKILTWLKRGDPRPPLSQISRSVLQGAFLRGEAKGLWLRGTHTRSPIRPDTKHITGMRVQDALSPLDDSSFAMAAARSSLPDSATSTALLGPIGTTPGKGFVWNRQSLGFDDFLKASIEALELIEDTILNGTPLDRPFPILAVESRDLADVHSAYDILTITPDELPTSSDVTDEMADAAEVLRQASFELTGSPSSPDFKLNVKIDGSLGIIQGKVRMKGDEVAFDFSYLAGSSPSVQKVLHALKRHELLAVYYDSGHTIGASGIASRNINPTPFTNWKFLDFSDFDITVEKPGTTPKEIHAKIGERGDKSLFSWVSQYYSSGWLICDDGPGEAADFIHINPEGVLSLIHVKAAHSNSPQRNIAVSAYEVVTGQAAKNGRYLIDLVSLSEVLQIPQKQRFASWIDGRRVADRTEFLGILDCLHPSDRKQVIIVQPHVSREIHERTRASNRGNPSVLRLSSLETLLNTTRGAVVALGADLQVIGSQQ